MRFANAIASLHAQIEDQPHYSILGLGCLITFQFGMLRDRLVWHFGKLTRDRYIRVLV